MTTPRRVMLRAIASAMLDGALPEERRERALDDAVAGVEVAVAGLPPSLQRELEQLFGLLGFPLTRRVLARTGPWERASRADVAAFLQRWRTSRIALLRGGYQALHQLIMAGWYGQTQAWPRIDYPGPPVLE